MQIGTFDKNGQMTGSREVTLENCRELLHLDTIFKVGDRVQLKASYPGIDTGTIVIMRADAGSGAAIVRFDSTSREIECRLSWLKLKG